MSTPQFFKFFLITSVVTAGLLIGLCQLTLFEPFLPFSLVTLVVFMLLTLLMFWVGKISANSKNKGLFTTLAMGFTFGKIFLSILVVIGYHQLFEPPSRLFLLPFFIVYLLFTVLETYMLMQIGQEKQIAG